MDEDFIKVEPFLGEEVANIKEEKVVETIKEENEVETIKEENEVETIKEENEVETIKEEKEVETIKEEKEVASFEDEEPFLAGPIKIEYPPAFESSSPNDDNENEADINPAFSAKEEEMEEEPSITLPPCDEPPECDPLSLETFEAGPSVKGPTLGLLSAEEDKRDDSSLFTDTSSEDFRPSVSDSSSKKRFVRAKISENSDFRISEKRKRRPPHRCHLRKCHEIITDEVGDSIFQDYCDLQTYYERFLFLVDRMEGSGVKQHRPRDGTKQPKSITYKYFFYVNGERVQVCKTTFLNTLGETDNFLRQCMVKWDKFKALSNKRESSVDSGTLDERKNKRSKTEEEDVKLSQNVINEDCKPSDIDLSSEKRSVKGKKDVKNRQISVIPRSTLKGRILGKGERKRPHHCRIRQCHEIITDEVGEALYRDYWDLQSVDERVLYVVSRVEWSDIKQHRPRDGSKTPKSISYKYYFDLNGKRVQVCRSTFRDTIGESDNFLRQCMVSLVDWAVPETVFMDSAS